MEFQLNRSMATITVKLNAKQVYSEYKKITSKYSLLEQKMKNGLDLKIKTKGLNLGGISGGSSMGIGKTAVAGALGGGLMKVADFLLGSGLEFSKLLMRAGTGVSGLTSKLEKFQNALNIYNEPQKEALSRADQIDALDDERRSHNTKTNAEEFGWSRAFSSVSGLNGRQVIDNLQAYIDKATSGDMAEMDKAWKNLNPMGITWEDLQNGNTWEVLAKMLQSYSAAGEDGMNELEMAFQQIFGKKQMGIIRKLGNGDELVTQSALLRGDYDKTISPIESKILDAAAQSEIIRSQAEIHNMAIPESGIKYVEEGAQHQLNAAKLNYQMLGEDGKQALDVAWQQLQEDLGATGLMERF